MNFFFGGSDFFGAGGAVAGGRCFGLFVLREERREVQTRRRQLRLDMLGSVGQQQRTCQLILAQRGFQIFRFDAAFRGLEGAAGRDLQLRPRFPQLRQTVGCQFEIEARSSDRA